jgi:hypothetical protein
MLRIIVLCSFCLLSSLQGVDFQTPIEVSTPGQDSSNPQIAFGAGGNAIAIWSSAATNTIQASNTTDGGISWQTPINISAISSFTALRPEVAFGAAGNAIAVWSINDGVNYFIQASKTTDGGASWQTPINLSTVSSLADVPQIAFGVGGNAIAVWQRIDGGNLVIQASKTIDGGTSWQTPITLSGSSGFPASIPQIAFGTGGNAIVVWVEANGVNNVINASKTIDGGTSWQTPITLSIPSLIPGQNAGLPQIAFGEGGNAIAVWQRNDGLTNIIQASKTTDGGTSWQTPINLSITGQDGAIPQIAFGEGGNAIAVWSNNNVGVTSIQASKTSDGGTSWQTPINLSTGTNLGSPQISFRADGNAIVVWTDVSNEIIQSSQSADSGASWQTPINLSSGLSSRPQIDFGTGSVIAVWITTVGINNIVMASSALAPSPSPFTFTVFGKQTTVNSLFQKDIVNEISWNSISEAKAYNVFDSSNQLISQSTSLSFFDHGKKRGISYIYFVTWINSSDVQSDPVMVTIP